MSYTGTTWINLLLGCHEDTFALGPPDRFYELNDKSQAAKLCLVHGESCPLWPAFCERYDREQNFLVQIAEVVKKRSFIINNPIMDGFGRELDGPGIEVLPVFVVRDGRAVTASYARHFSVSFEDALADWYAPAIGGLLETMKAKNDLVLRYEDVLESPVRQLQQIGDWLGITYSERLRDYWLWKHHPIMANQGTVAMLRLHEGIPLMNFRGREFYEEQFKTLNENPSQSFADDRWKTDLTPRERFLFDHYCGSGNAQMGYSRDTFNASEVRDWKHELPIPETISFRTRLTQFSRRLVNKLGREA